MDLDHIYDGLYDLDDRSIYIFLRRRRRRNYIILRQKAARFSLPHLKTVQLRQRQFIYRSDQIRSIRP
jgi:hypothetical protein